MKTPERNGGLAWFLLAMASAIITSVGLVMFAVSIAKIPFWGSALLQPATLVTILYIRLMEYCCGAKMVRSKSPYWKIA